MRILLVEPSYRNKFPPLGLMKISAYHKMRGDYVEFVKGYSPKHKQLTWDRIYISSLFTFYWSTTLKTINYYLKSTSSPSNVIVGGVLATLMGEEIENLTGVRVISGLLNKAGALDAKDRHIIDEMTPDYRILDEITYDYGLKNAYLGYATRGCPNNCSFCAVNCLEPNFIHYLPLKKQVKSIEEIYGPKQDLILMDNNVLASNNFQEIVKDIINLGFHKEAKFNRKLRRVDFNQGIDGRLINETNMSLLSQIAIKPLRIAFDNISMKDIYIKAVELANKYEINNLSNYILYNHNDHPKDFYDRLKINVLLNKQLGTKIYSFPMKYIPLNAKDRTFVGKHWNRQMLRGIQCVLLATRGMVTPRLEFFEAAFGRNFEEFKKITLMPERYIINRKKHENNGAADWKHLYKNLSESETNDFLNIISKQAIKKDSISSSSSVKLKKLLSHYINAEN